jgi:hypothetical protein
MSNTWITATEAATIISRNSRHAVSLHHIQTLIHRCQTDFDTATLFYEQKNDGETLVLAR